MVNSHGFAMKSIISSLCTSIVAVAQGIHICHEGPEKTLRREEKLDAYLQIAAQGLSPIDYARDWEAGIAVAFPGYFR